MNSRQDANRRIVMYLFDMIEKEPDLRFGQILQALDVVKADTIDDRDCYLKYWDDEFYLEPELLLERVEEAAHKLLEDL